MHTYTYIYIHMHTYTHTYTYIYIHIHTYTGPGARAPERRDPVAHARPEPGKPLSRTDGVDNESRSRGVPEKSICQKT